VMGVAEEAEVVAEDTDGEVMATDGEMEEEEEGADNGSPTWSFC